MILLVGSIALGASLFFIYLIYFIVMRNSCKRGINWNSCKLKTTVSLIVATYNEEDTLPSKLKNVLEQDYEKKMLELVIIDSGSTDKTPAIIEEFIHENPDLNIIFIKEKERLGKSHAVNIAYSKASGEIKIISDADAILEKSAISKITSNFCDSHIGAACGRQVLLNVEQNPTTMLEKSYRDFFEILREGESILDSTPIFHGELAAFRADLIEPIPENTSADDSRLANIIRGKGYRAVYDSKAVFYEYAPPNSRARFIQKVRRGQGLIRVFWDFRDRMFKREYGRYGRLILPIEFLMHCVFPTLWLIFIALFFVSLALYIPILLLFPIALLAFVLVISRARGKNVILMKAKRVSSLFLSFFSSQFLLFYALVLWVSGRSLHKWQKVEEIREEWKAK